MPGRVGRCTFQPGSNDPSESDRLSVGTPTGPMLPSTHLGPAARLGEHAESPPHRNFLSTWNCKSDSPGRKLGARAELIVLLIGPPRHLQFSGETTSKASHTAAAMIEPMEGAVGTLGLCRDPDAHPWQQDVLQCLAVLERRETQRGSILRPQGMAHDLVGECATGKVTMGRPRSDETPRRDLRLRTLRSILHNHSPQAAASAEVGS